MLRIFIEDNCEKVTETGCWLWMKSRTSSGYGDFRKDKKHHYAHRVSWVAHNGEIPDDLHVLHKCDTPSCCNPDHLFLGTNQDNIADSVSKGRRKGITRDRPSGLIYKPQSVESRRNKRKLPKHIAEMVLNEVGISQRALAKKYGVSPATIHNIQHRGA